MTDTSRFFLAGAATEETPDLATAHRLLAAGLPEVDPQLGRLLVWLTEGDNFQQAVDRWPGTSIKSLAGVCDGWPRAELMRLKQAAKELRRLGGEEHAASLGYFVAIAGLLRDGLALSEVSVNPPRLIGSALLDMAEVLPPPWCDYLAGASELCCAGTEPLAVETPKHNHFPKTQGTFVRGCLQGGDEGRRIMNRHLMEVYALPLQIYFRGHSLRDLGDAEDVVQGFFADRLDRGRFMPDWEASGMRLHRWLINGFNFYLKEVVREKVRERRYQALPADLDHCPTEERAELELERAYARSLVQRALSRAGSECTGKWDQHWRIFVEHEYHERPYRDLEPELEVTRERAAVMARVGKKRFRDVLLRLAREDMVKTSVSRESSGISTADVEDRIRTLVQATR
ncbi:MAG: hypothetical protein AB7O52_06880 [Planctomycetota bacterium]